MEPLIPLGHWLWGVIAVLCVLPGTIYFGLPLIRRWVRGVKEDDREYQGALAEARRTLAEGEELDRQVEQIRVETLKLKLFRRLWRRLEQDS